MNTTSLHFSPNALLIAHPLRAKNSVFVERERERVTLHLTNAQPLFPHPGIRFAELQASIGYSLLPLAEMQAQIGGTITPLAKLQASYPGETPATTTITIADHAEEVTIAVGDLVVG